MNKKFLWYRITFFVMLLAIIAFLGVAVKAQTVEDADLVALGKALFFDPDLSINRTQSCASCHAPATGFTGPDSFVNAHGAMYQGALEQHFGDRRPPTSAYAGYSPALHYDETLESWVGGMFWDGRASGDVWGDPLAEQAGGPFLNPLEQAFPDERQLVVRVAKAEYADLFEQVWGAGSLDFVKDVSGTYERIARSIAAYERSAEVNPYSSKFDLFWDNAVAAGKDVTKIKCPSGGNGMGMGPCGMGGGMGGGGMGGGGSLDPYRWQNYRNLGLTEQELQGLATFNDPNRANCTSCHSLAPGPDGYPLFTDFSYHNLGVPKNPENPFYAMPPFWNPEGTQWVDLGLGAYLMSRGEPAEVYEGQMGKFKVPSLRNVDLRPSDDFVKAYTHNGSFKSLDEIILFYSWRGLVMNGGLGMGGNGMDCSSGGMDGGMGSGMMCDPNLFPSAEYDQNMTPMNHFNMMDIANIVVFLSTLSDGYFER